MWAIAIAGLVVLAFAAVWLGFVPPPHASTLLHVREGAIRVSRGQLKPHAKEQVLEILSEAAVTKGFIAVTPGNRVRFSRHIPASAHQRLRNVLLNQWA
jgi:hypothetical protein